MTNFSLTLHGDEELIRKLTNTAIVQGELEDAATRSAAVVTTRARSYPPARPSSTYRRTRRLGNSWDFTVRPLAAGVIALVDNPTEYAAVVMDPDEQAAVHQGRWATTRAILREKQRQIVGFFEFARDSIVRRLGL